MSIAVVAAAVIPQARRAAMQAAGSALVAADPIARADVGVITEFGEGSELEAADLYQQHVFSRIVLLEPSPTPVKIEYMRRGVYLDDTVVTTLQQLGVPGDAIVHVDAGEGGTTESAQALASWIRGHPSRAIVIVVPSHTRRYRRTLRRVWPAGAPLPAVTSGRHNGFRADDWWTRRRTLREGLVELQKLGLDYVMHPLP